MTCLNYGVFNFILDRSCPECRISEIHFTKVAEAADYRQTLALERSTSIEAKPIVNRQF